MTVKKIDAPTQLRYDWTPLAIAAVSDPGQWYCEDDPDRPKTNSHQIRRGTPAVFDPPGAFDAISRKSGTYVRYLGVPLRPWISWEEGEDFETLERTLDPELFPAETSARFVAFATAHTPAKAIKRERKRRATPNE